MGLTLLCMLGFILTETLLKSGQSEAAQVNATLRADNTTIPAGGAVVLTCSVESVNNPSGWKYQWFRRTNGSTQAISVSNSNTSVTRGGDYWCKARRTDSSAFTANSNVVPIYELVSSRPVVTLEPSGTQIFGGETKTLRCEIHGGEDIKWEYEWMAPNSGISSNSKEYKMGKVVASDGSDYRCRGIRRGDIYSSTEWSETVTLTFYPTARAKISADKKDIPAGGSVTLTCSVIPPSPGWEYSWFRGRKIPEPLNPQDAVVLSSHQISVWKGGPYWCRARRGNPVYYTENTDYISLNQYIAKKAVSTIQPKWPRIYKEELITFSCDIEDEDYSEWDFEWRGRGSYRPPRQQKVLTHAYAFYNGQYTCVGKRKNEPTTMTAWSEPVSLTVYDYIPKPILAVTPSWLSPGDPVTLHCDIKYPSAGWRFYWYKAVPKLQKSYSYELLPDSNSGTASNSYVVHGQTHTAGYACRAGRGDPIYYTRYSDVKFVWSGDVQSASLTVSTNRVQHFTSDSVTLSCQGSSAQWRVKVVEEEISKLDDPDCKAMTGATCTISRVQEGSSVYWCESDAGEFSNAVNISADKKNLILLSPVHPLTEGDSFTLGCKLKTGTFDCNVVFLRNDQVIRKDTGETLKITAVSKSDEGFYKCRCGKKESPQSWVSIKSQPKSSALVPGLVGLFLVITVIVLLLLLCHYKKVKYPSFDRMCHILRNNQETAADQTTYQNESQQHVYSSLVHGDVSIYESIGPTFTGNDMAEYENSDVTTSIELKDLQKHGKRDVSMDVNEDYVNPKSATDP